MTAKHRKGKNNNKYEENSFKHDVPEVEERSGNHYTLIFILFLIVIIGGATIGWLWFQQQQTLSHLTDNLMGMQMKMVRLQSQQEEFRKSSDKQGLEGIEQRLNSLEDSYGLAQKQVGMALATAEQLKTSDLPAQVLALHTEMKARLAEVQQAAVSTDQLAQLTEALGKQSQEFQAVKQQVQDLTSVGAELAQKVEGFSGSLVDSEAKLEDRAAAIEALGAQLGDLAIKLQGLKDLVAAQQGQVDTSTQEINDVRILLETEASKRSRQVEIEEQLNAMRQSLQDHSTTTHDLYSDLRAKMTSIQGQVAQLESSATPEVAAIEADVVKTAETAEAAEIEDKPEAAVDAEDAIGEDMEAVDTVSEDVKAAAEDLSLLKAEKEATQVEEETPQGEESTEQEAVEEAPSIEESVAEEEEEAAPAATEEVEMAEEELAASEPGMVEKEELAEEQLAEE